MGLAIIALTLLVRLLLVKQATAGMKMQGELTDMQPKMQEIQEKYKDDPQRMSSEMMQLLKKSGGGPLKGCLTMLIQIPVFLGLFFTIKELANEHFTTELYSFLYSFSIQLDAINTDFLGMQLLDNHNVLFTMLAGLAMWAQLKLTALVNPPKKASLPGMDKEGMPDMSMPGSDAWHGHIRHTYFVQNDGNYEYCLRDHDGMICMEYAECNWSLYNYDYPLWGDSTSNPV